MMESTDRTVTFDSETNTYRVRHDWRTDEPMSTTLVLGVAAVTNTPPTEVDPLYEFVDPDALDRIFDPTAGSSLHRSEGRATFTMNGCSVTVHGNGEISISPSDESEE